jgi:outer membrane cobalamin receptor
MVTQKIRFDAGMKMRSQLMCDRQSENFNYRDDVYAFYGSASGDMLKFKIKAGLRAESSISDFDGSGRKNFSLLPDVTINYRLNQKHDFSFAWNRTTRRPDLHELNPNTSYSDLFSERSGNMFLTPELFQNTSLKYSRSSANNFFSFLTYYRKRMNIIDSYSVIDKKGILATGTANLGDIRAWGLEVNGSFKILKIVSVNTYFNIFSLQTSVNSVAVQYGIGNKQNLSFQSGVSAIAGFSHDITASFRFQYNTPSTGIQLETFSDPLYFVALEKGFCKKYKVTINSALPFFRSFIYTGSETTCSGFNNRNEGIIRLSRIPLWVTFKYQFNPGNKVKRIDRTKEEISNVPSKGF